MSPLVSPPLVLSPVAGGGVVGVIDVTGSSVPVGGVVLGSGAGIVTSSVLPGGVIVGSTGLSSTGGTGCVVSVPVLSSVVFGSKLTHPLL